MKARMIGFKWTLGGGVSLQELFTAFKNCEGTEIHFAKFDRLFYVADIGDYHVGLLLTVKDQRKTCEIKKARGQYKLSVRKIAKGTSLVDFNFVIVHKLTSRGLYLHYHQSCSVKQFTYFCRKMYHQLRDEQRDAKLALLGKNPTVAQVDAVKKAHPMRGGSIEIELMVRQENLGDLISELRTINSLDFNFLAVTDEESMFRPLGDKVREVHRGVTFTRSTGVNDVKDAILNIIRANKISRGSIAGHEEDGTPRILDLEKNLESFGEFDHDDIADEVTLNLSAVEQSPLLKKMHTAARADKMIFEHPAQ